MEFKHTCEEAQQIWSDALRSGEYKQGKHYLRIKGNRYCCLGVACELAIQHEPEIAKVLKRKDGVESDDETHSVYTDSSDGSKVCYEEECPHVVQDWLALDDSMGGYFGANPGTTYSLAYDNDNEASFEEIAGLIDTKQRGLFRKCRVENGTSDETS